MKSPVDTVKGKIVDYDPVTMEMTIVCKYDDVYTMMRREYKECLVQMVDSRKLSDRQRKACYALLREISDYTGMSLEMTKQYMKLKFLADDLQETADKLFSLSNAPMSLVCAFQRHLVRFIIEFSIPTKIPLAEYADDIQDYVYACTANGVCCVCGQSAEAHHYKRLGMGSNRKQVNHIGMLIEPLCRKHHEECHTMPQRDFDEKYHIIPISVDKIVAKAFDLSGKNEVEIEVG